MRSAELLELQSLSPGGEKVTKSCISQRANVSTRPNSLNWTVGQDFVLARLSKKCTLTARTWFGSSNSRGGTCLSSFFLDFIIMGKRALSKLIGRYRTGKYFAKVLQNASINLHICFEHIWEEPEACLFSKPAVGKNPLGIREALCSNFPRIIMSNEWQ